MQTEITDTDLTAMEQRKRAHLVNSAGGLKRVCPIGTADTPVNTDLVIFNSIAHIGANPPLISFILWPDSAERRTLCDILETGCYTINGVNENIYERAHQTSARYPGLKYTKP